MAVKKDMLYRLSPTSIIAIGDFSHVKENKTLEKKIEICGTVATEPDSRISKDLFMSILFINRDEIL